MAGKNHAAEPDPQTPAAPENPQSDNDIMSGYEQFAVFQGDFMADEDVDHSGQGSTGQPAAPSDDGTTSPDDGTPPPPPATGKPAGGDDAGGQTGDSQVYNRHNTKEEAEKSYANLLSRTTRAEQENKALKEKLDKIENDRIEADRQAEIQQQKDEFLNQKYEEATQQVDELDPEDPEYHKKVARIWADAHKAIENFTPQVSDAGGGAGGEETPAVSSVLPSDRSPAADGQTGPAGQEAGPASGAPAEDGGGAADDGGAAADGLTMEQIQAKLQTALETQKVDFDATDPAFRAICAATPSEDQEGNPLTIDDQIQHAISQTRDHYEQVRRRYMQETAQPMSRSGQSGPAAGPGASSNDDKATFSDVLEEAVQSRTL